MFAWMHVILHELQDSIRSRRAVVLVALYTLGAAASTYTFSRVLHSLEQHATEALGLGNPGVTRSFAEVLRSSPEVFKALEELTGDAEFARALTELPPLALFYGWLAFTFVPILVVLLSSSRIAEQVWSGAVRYEVIRCSKLAWCLGKYWGQALQVLVAVLVGAFGAWVTGYFAFDHFDGLATFFTLINFSLRAWVFSLAYLGLAMGVSQVMRGPNVAMGLSLILLLLVTILTGVCRYFLRFDDAGFWWSPLANAMPVHHRSGLWLSDPGAIIQSSLALLLIGFVYFLIGHLLVFRRKDL